MAISFKKRKREILRRALWQSGLVLIGATTWISLFRINDPLAFSEAWKSMISIQGVFLSCLAIMAGIISHALVGNRQYRVVDEALFAFILIIMAGLAEAWGMGLRPAFLPALVMVVYLMTKIWMNYNADKRLLKRAYK